MNSKERRNYIEGLLKKNNTPQKGHILAEELGVTRQVIVKDIAILRAEGKKIIATPEGYLVPKEEKIMVKKVIAVSHGTSSIDEELKVIVKFGGIVEDVIVEHPLYGEIRGMIMVKTFYDIENFVKKISEYNAEPLLILTGGVHLHTIAAENEDIVNNIINELKSKNYLVSD